MAFLFETEEEKQMASLRSHAATFSYFAILSSICSLKAAADCPGLYGKFAWLAFATMAVWLAWMHFDAGRISFVVILGLAGFEIWRTAGDSMPSPLFWGSMAIVCTSVCIVSFLSWKLEARKKSTR